MPEFKKACRVNDIPARSGKRVFVEDKNVALFRTGSQVVAFLNRCPHQGAEISDGYLKDAKIYCPHHQWSFDFPGGSLSFNKEVGLISYEVRIENEEVFVKVF